MSALGRGDSCLDAGDTAADDQNLLRSLLRRRELVNIKRQVSHGVDGTMAYIYGKLLAGERKIVVALLRGTGEALVAS